MTGRGEFEAATGPDREFVGASGWRAYLQALGPGLITGASDDFWQALQRVEDMDKEDGGERAVPLRRRTRRAGRSKLLTSRFDVFTGMAFSQVVMFAIITATAATLGRTHRLAGGVD